MRKNFREGHRLAKNRERFTKYADTVPPVAIKGVRELGPKGFAKVLKVLGASTEFITKKGVPVVGALLVFNNAIAQGKTPAAACVIAGFEEINVLPVGYEEFDEAGRKYNAMMEHMMNNNVHGKRGGGNEYEDGFPIYRPIGQPPTPVYKPGTTP